MGCDIHFYTERYTSDNDYGGPRDLEDDRNSSLEVILDERTSERSKRWVSADKWKLEDAYEDEEPWWDTISEERFYRGRNYYLFSVLAGVRGDGDKNLGVDEHGPKGIPDDASFGFRSVVKQWDGDGHSHSYFTLEELLSINWSDYNQEDWLDDFIVTIDKMKSIDTDPTKVRCVFFFDN
jgi:hypothetical protein